MRAVAALAYDIMQLGIDHSPEYWERARGSLPDFKNPAELLPEAAIVEAKMMHVVIGTGH